MASYVDLGQDIGKHLKADGITTSQIRKFLSAVNSVANKVQNEKEQLSSSLSDEIQYLRVKLAYQAGRESLPKGFHGNVKEFGLHYLQSILDEALKKIGNSKAEFEKFNRLVESIVAYHRFYGGKD
jgi:CRISPR type III-A-associated protein Csm2